MKIAVTGARGLVGNAVVDHCISMGDDLTALSHADLDITDSKSIAAMFSGVRPDVLINCAAYTDVDGAESDQELCDLVNNTAVGYLSAAAKKSGTVFVTISTDYVFDGLKSGFYAEEDLPLPLSVYGKSKAAGERAAYAANESAIIVRTGWIFGKGGTNFLSLIPQLLEQGKQLTAIADQFGTPTYAADLAKRLRELAVSGETGLFHVTNSGNGTSYAGFAKLIAEVGGFDRSLVTETSASDLKRPALRPQNSRLACKSATMFGISELPDWKDAVGRYLKVL